MKVAVGVIFNKEKQILITQRSLKTSHGGQWEFPGGKVEEGETPFSALIREVNEEVGLQITHASFLCEVVHAYPAKTVTLIVYCVDEFIGSPTCCESQIDFRWVDLKKLSTYDFPEANTKIIRQLVVQHESSNQQLGSIIN